MDQYRRAITNHASRLLGAEFESIIADACAYYKRAAEAYIEKTPEPMKPISGKDSHGHFKSVFTKRAQPDFKGTLKTGRAVCFEAKATNKDRIAQDRITREQAEALDTHQAMGALVFVLVSFHRMNYYRIPWSAWKTMKEWSKHKYVTEEDIRHFKINFNGKTGMLEFLKDTDFKRG